MAIRAKIDSNITGLRYAEEVSPKVLPVSPIWWPLEPNSYKDFGGSVKTQARTPISSNRQRKKGIVTDVDAGGGFATDVTQTNIQDLLQGFMFANFRRKPEKGGYAASAFTTVAAADKSINAASGLSSFVAGSLVFASGFSVPGNNGLKLVATAASGKITVAETMYDENAPADARVVKVGVQGSAGDFAIDVTGDLPKLTSSSLDFTTLGITPGEWVFVGSDSATSQFNNGVNNGFKRVRKIQAGYLEFDKSVSVMVAEGGGTKTIRLYMPRVLRNEDTTSIVKRTYQLERTLGQPDDAAPTETQAEYLLAAVPNELVLNMATADKLTADLSFVAAEHELRDHVTGPKGGARPAIIESTGFNTSSDFSRIKMNVVDPTNESPTPLFAYVTEASLTIKNNVTPNKVIGSVGAVDMTAGNFEVAGTLTAYFSTVEAIQAVKDNASVTIDLALVKDNAGIVIDLPLITLGEGRASIEQDQAITLPLGFDGAISGNGYTMMLCFFDYLPALAG